MVAGAGGGGSYYSSGSSGGYVSPLSSSFYKGLNSSQGGGGGGGYFGGSAGSTDSGGSGGTSFVSGHNGCDAITESSTSSNVFCSGQPNHYSGRIFTDTVIIDGSGYNWTNVKGDYIGMPSHDGTSTITGNSGNGYAKITYIG